MTFPHLVWREGQSKILQFGCFVFGIKQSHKKRNLGASFKDVDLFMLVEPPLV